MHAVSSESEQSIEGKKNPVRPVAAKEPTATQKPQPASVTHPPTPTCAHQVDGAAVQCTTCSHAHTQTMIVSLTNRVAGVEATVVAALGKIAEKLSEMQAQHVGQGYGTAVGKQQAHVEVATSTPTAWMRASSSRKVGGGVVDIASDSQPPPHPTPHTGLTRVAPTPAIDESEDNTSATESHDATPKATKKKDHPGRKKRIQVISSSHTEDSVPPMQPRSRNTPLRYGIHCWVMHPDYNNAVIGIARAGVNSRSRSHHTDLVHSCEEGQQCILFKKLFRHDIPLLFQDFAHTGPKKTCDSVLWVSGKGEKWVRWSCKFLREKMDDDALPRGV